jgi:hypothetical protein
MAGTTYFSANSDRDGNSIWFVRFVGRMKSGSSGGPVFAALQKVAVCSAVVGFTVAYVALVSGSAAWGIVDVILRGPHSHQTES